MAFGSHFAPPTKLLPQFHSHSVVFKHFSTVIPHYEFLDLQVSSAAARITPSSSPARIASTASTVFTLS